MESPKNSLQNCFFIFSDILKNTLQKNCKKRTKKCIFFLLRPFLNNFFGGLVVGKSKFGKNNFFVKKILFLFVFKFFFYVDPGPSIDLKSSYGKITWEKKRYTPLMEPHNRMKLGQFKRSVFCYPSKLCTNIYVRTFMYNIMYHASFLLK